MYCQWNFHADGPPWSWRLLSDERITKRAWSTEKEEQMWRKTTTSVPEHPPKISKPTKRSFAVFCPSSKWKVVVSLGGTVIYTVLNNELYAECWQCNVETVVSDTFYLFYLYSLHSRFIALLALLVTQIINEVFCDSHLKNTFTVIKTMILSLRQCTTFFLVPYLGIWYISSIQTSSIYKLYLTSASRSAVGWFLCHQFLKLMFLLRDDDGTNDNTSISKLLQT